LQADVMAIGRVNGRGPEFVRVELDHCGFVDTQHNEFIRRVSEAAELPTEQVIVGYSHSHAAGWYMPDRFQLPGGELIPGYLEQVGARLETATRLAIADMAPAIFTYATAECPLAGHRDCWDEESNQFVCGYNPGGPADHTVTVARITAPEGRLRGVLVHYGCHPTTLGWDNTLISPDYVGALRETVTKETGAPCIYWQGACGDLGPREGFVGDVAVADRNGRLLAYSALAALETLGPPETEFRYAGPVLSGATLGAWRHAPIDRGRSESGQRVAGGRFAVSLPRLEWERKTEEAHRAGDPVAERDCRARAERARRWLGRIASLPPGGSYPLSASAHVVGDAIWITSGGEPYQWLADALRRRFPEQTVLYSPLADGVQVGYLLPEGEYGKGLYQEEPSILAKGCLESLRDALVSRTDALLARTSGWEAA